MSPNYPKMEDCMQVVAPVNVNSTISANTRPSSTTGISTNTSNLVLVLGFQPRVVAPAIAIVSLGMIFHLPTATVRCSAANLKVYMYSDLKIVTRNFKSDLKVYTFMSPKVVILARKNCAPSPLPSPPHGGSLSSPLSSSVLSSPALPPSLV
ncbi:hypothetical protein L6452_36743 [Arctium lappa]|uniref:Uncharacterized protein n=1 Tax=Arctium lappa TaxID=4217 RepID=A0ACB8Y280_ARCLA|nr:hypothetical protein L6452_36743 [Arctium lappa]